MVTFFRLFILLFPFVRLVCLFKDIFVVIRAVVIVVVVVVVVAIVCNAYFSCCVSSNYSTLSVSEWDWDCVYEYLLVTLFNRLNVNGFTSVTNSGADTSVCARVYLAYKRMEINKTQIQTKKRTFSIIVHFIHSVPFARFLPIEFSPSLWILRAAYVHTPNCH